MGRYDDQSLNTTPVTPTPTVGRFEQQSSVTPTPDVSKIVNAIPSKKTEQLKLEAAQAQKEADQANSFWGKTKNFITAVPGAVKDTLVNIPKGIYNNLTNPSEEQKNFESYTGLDVNKPGYLPSKYNPVKYITRFINPGLQPIATDLAEIKAVKEKGGFIDQINQGKMPPSYLNEIAVIHKNFPEIAGDVAQAVLTAYAGGEGSSLIKGSINTGVKDSVIAGIKSGLSTGELFGGAQALSSGTKNPLEFLSMVGTSGVAGGIIGGITSGAIPVSKDILNKVKQIDTTKTYAGHIANPLFKSEELNKAAENLDKTNISKETFLKQFTEPEKVHEPVIAKMKEVLKKEGLTPDEFYNKVKSNITPEKIDGIKQIISNNRSEKIVTETALDKANNERQLQQEKSDYIKSKVGKLKSYSEKDIAEYNQKVREITKEFEAFKGEKAVNSSQKISESLPAQLEVKDNVNKDTLQKVSTQQKEPTTSEGKITIEKVGEKYPSKESIPQNFDADKYVKEQIAKREAAKVSGISSFKTNVRKFLANAKKKLVDFSAPIEDILNETVKKNKLKLKPSEDIHNQIDRVLRSPTIAGEFAREKGLVDVIKNVKNIDHFDQYLIAKHAVELEEKGIVTGRDIGKDKALVESLKKEYEPFAKKISQYSRDLLDYTVDSGLISKELADKLKERYPDYVPFNRVFNELEKAGNFDGATSGVASLSKQNIIQKIEGSTREVESPLESLLSKTNDAFKQGEKNISGKILAGYKDLPGNPFGLRELGKGETAANTISYLDNGTKRTFETLPEVAQAAKALNVQQLNILGKIFAAPVRIAKIGITGINIAFTAANIAKDQLTAFINSNHGLKTSLANPVNFTKSLFSAVGHDKLYREMVKEGGGGTSFDIAREQTPKTIEQIRASKSVGSKVLYVAKNPSQLLRAVEDIIGRSEELTRIQQYRGTREALIKEGMSPKEARIAAARAARENTVNFSRRGEWGQVLNSAFLYLNAGIQGTRTLLRNFKEKPIATTTKVVIAAMTPVAMATAWNLSSPDRKKAYEDIPEYEKQNNLIIIPPNPKQDANGKWNVIKIPMSQEVNNLVSIPRRAIESAEGLDPLKFSDFAKGIIGTVEPIEPSKGALLSTFTPQAIKPTIEGAVNRNLYTGFPQVPQSLEKLSPQKQVKSGTSGTARKIGKLLNVSPLKAEAFIKETFGGAGSQALNVVDQVLSKTGAIPKDQVGGQGVLDAITSRFSKASGGELNNKQIDEIQKLITKQADESADLKNEAESKWTELKSLPQDEAEKQFNQISADNPKLAAKISTIADDESKGLDVTDRFIKQLQVTNGERAQYMADKFNALSTDEEKAALWEEYSSKGLISASVAEQLSTLLNK